MVNSSAEEKDLLKKYRPTTFTKFTVVIKASSKTIQVSSNLSHIFAISFISLVLLFPDGAGYYFLYPKAAKTSGPYLAIYCVYSGTRVAWRAAISAALSSFTCIPAACMLAITFFSASRLY